MSRGLPIDWALMFDRARKAGWDVSDLALHLDVDLRTVRYHADRLGIVWRRKPHASPKGIDWPAVLDAARHEDLTAIALAGRLSVARQTVYSALRRHGLCLSERRDWTAEFARAAAAGETQSQLARRLGVSRQAVTKAKKRLLKTTGRGPSSATPT